jgi:hypothetical protein
MSSPDHPSTDVNSPPPAADAPVANDPDTEQGPHTAIEVDVRLPLFMSLLIAFQPTSNTFHRAPKPTQHLVKSTRRPLSLSILAVTLWISFR